MNTDEPARTERRRTTAVRRFQLRRCKTGGVVTEPFEWGCTKRPAHVVRAENRRRNKVVRASRKANR